MTVEYKGVDLLADLGEDNSSVSGGLRMSHELLVCLLCITCANVIANNVHSLRAGT